MQRLKPAVCNPIVVIIIVLTLAFLTPRCNNNNQDASRSTSESDSAEAISQPQLKNLVLERFCESAKPSPQDPQVFDFVEKYRTAKGQLQVSGKYYCLGAFPVSLPPDPENPEEEITIDNYNFYAQLRLNFEKKVVDVTIARDSLFAKQSPEIKKYGYVRSFTPTEKYDIKKDLLHLDFGIINLATYEVNPMSLLLSRTGTFTLEARED